MKIPLPFGLRLETRASSTSYTDVVTAALIARASGAQLVHAGATAALEAATGIVGRSFAVAQVSGRRMVADALTPGILEMTGRSLIRNGQAVYLIRTTSGLLELVPVSSYEVYGPSNPAEWVYSLDVATPNSTERYTRISSDQVVHVKYAASPSSPYRGQGPIEIASLAGKLSAEVTAALGNEMAGPHGQSLLTPKDGDDSGLAGVKADIGAAKGRLVMLEAGDMDNPGGGRQTGMVSRYGAEPPQSMVQLAQLAFNEVLAACGISPAMYGGSDGTALRESQRQLLHHTISPLSRLVQAELRLKVDSTITIEHGELMASDSQGKARAFQSLVGGGMAVERAVVLSGLMVSDE